MYKLAPFLALLCLLEFSSPLWAGTSGTDRWFARPTAECPVNGDGTAYHCAAQAGAAGAFAGFTGLDWTPQTGIDDGDTLTLCGSFGFADRRNNTTILEVDASGRSDAPITVDGNCTAYGGPRKAAIDGAGFTKFAVLTNDRSHLRIINIAAANTNNTQTGANFRSALGNDVHFVNDETAGGFIGLSMGGSAFVIDGLVVTSNTTTTDVVNIGVTATDGVIRNSHLIGPSWNNADVIEIQGDAITAILIENNTLEKRNSDKSTVTIKHGNGTFLVRANDFNGGGTDSYGIRTPSTFGGKLQIEDNLFHGYGDISGNVIQLDNAERSAEATITGNLFDGGAYQLVINDGWSAHVTKNTFARAGIAAIYSGGLPGGGGAQVTIRDNIFYDSTRHIKSFGFEQVFVLDYNNYFGLGDFLVRNTELGSLTELRALGYEAHGSATSR